MEVRKTVSMFISIVLVGASAVSMAAGASDRGLAFKGALVNGGCNSQASSDLAQRTLDSTKPSLSLVVDPGLFRAACHEQNLPLEAHYVGSASAHAKRQAGVVTLTYQ